MTEVAAVFLDRDGTIIEDRHYLNDPEKVLLIAGVGAALRQLQEKGFLLFIVSNQSGISRGYINDQQFKAVHQKVCEVLQAEGVKISEFAYCFHHPDERCQCRKPAPGLIPKAFEGQKIQLDRSFVVGDSLCDLKLADAVGAQGCLVKTGKGMKTLGEIEAEQSKDRYWIGDDLTEIAAAIIS